MCGYSKGLPVDLWTPNDNRYELTLVLATSLGQTGTMVLLIRLVDKAWEIRAREPYY